MVVFRLCGQPAAQGSQCVRSFPIVQVAFELSLTWYVIAAIAWVTVVVAACEVWRRK